MPINAFQRIFDFGSKKDDTKNVSSSDAIKRLSDVEEMLNKKQQHLESQIEEEKTTAIRCSKQGNKRGALMALKRKKKYEKTLLQLDGTLTTLETQREYLQNSSTNMDVLRVMRQAASALKKTNQNLDADQVHDLMDDLSEQHSVAEEIANAISSPIGSSDLYNDADLERELELLAQEEIKEDMMKIGPLPDVPAQTGTIKLNNQSEELRELEAWGQ
jgi:charged multivesicular body protein 4